MRTFSRELLWWTTTSKLNKNRRKDRRALTDRKWWCQQTGGLWSSTAVVRITEQRQARAAIGKWWCLETDIWIYTFYASNKDKSWYRMDWKIIWNNINKLRVIWSEKSFLWMLKEATKADKSWWRERRHTRIFGVWQPTNRGESTKVGQNIMEPSEFRKPLVLIRTSLRTRSLRIINS